MLETVGAIVLSWWFLVALIAILSISCYYEAEAWSIFWLVCTVLVLYFLTNLSATAWLIIVAGYLPVGFAWSVYRFKRFCKAKYEDFLVTKSTSPSTLEIEKRTFTRKTDPKNNITKIASWIVVWPVSLILNIIDDFIDAIKTIVQKYLIKLYEKVGIKYTTLVMEQKVDKE